MGTKLLKVNLVVNKQLHVCKNYDLALELTFIEDTPSPRVPRVPRVLHMSCRAP